MVLPLLNKSFSKHILSLLTMLAVGCLCGDALFHLIPHSLGADKKIVIYRNETSDIAKEAPSEKDMTVVWKCALVLASIYMFYLLNNMMNFCQIGHTHSHGHSHTIPHVTLPVDNDSNSCKLEKKAWSNSKSESEKCKENLPDSERSKLLEGDAHKKTKTNFQIEVGDDGLSLHKIPRIVWMIMIGGFLHNLTDGLAVGASFAGSFPGGISTTLAILFHEIPHAIGDFVVLLSSGLRAKVAMTFISLTYSASFVGCFTGVALGKELNIVDWIFAVTAGMFLYIALVELLPDTIDDAEEHGPRHMSSFFWQNVGFLIGAGGMALIAAYEDAIKNALKQ
eukprot:gene16201-7573_t